VVTYLRCTIVDMALYSAPLDSLKATFTELRQERRYHNLLLGVLQDLVTHSSFHVRRYIAILFGVRLKPSLRFMLYIVHRELQDIKLEDTKDVYNSFGNESAYWVTAMMWPNAIACVNERMAELFFCVKVSDKESREL